MYYVSPLRYLPLEPEVRRAIDLGSGDPVFSIQMLKPREVQFVKNKLSKILTGTKYNFEIRGTRIYLVDR